MKVNVWNLTIFFALVVVVNVIFFIWLVFLDGSMPELDALLAGCKL